MQRVKGYPQKRVTDPKDKYIDAGDHTSLFVDYRTTVISADKAL